MVSFHPKYRRRQSHIFIKLFCIASIFIVLLNLIALYKYLDVKLNRNRQRGEKTIRSGLGYQGRKLLSVNGTTTLAPPTTQHIGDYPEDFFSLKQKEDGWIAMHCLGVLYMFVGLALVCDEFFVPALHVITSILKISDDVAGATFMAAGGSAPELFTSIIGVFFSDSQVGIGTIVGSAVFNVLFVIGMCAMFSKTLLNLTWWPLLRDSIFYIIALILLIAFFSDGRISWHEALGLFLVYIAYVLFMFKNSYIEMTVKAYISKKTRASSVTPVIDEKNGQDFLSLPAVFSKDAFRNGAIQLVIHTLDPIAETGVDDKFQKIKDHYDTVSSSTGKDGTSSLLEEKELLDSSATPPNQSQTTILPDDNQSNHQVARSASTIFQQQQKKRIENDLEMQHAHNSHPHPHTQPHAMENSNDTINGTLIQTDLNKAINALENMDNKEAMNHHDETNHTAPNSVSSSFIYDSSHPHHAHDDFRAGVDGISTRNSVRFSTRRLSRCSSRASSLSHRGLAPIKKGSPVEDDKDTEDENESESDEEGPLDWSWPDDNLERVCYVVKAPLMFLLFITLPDVRRPKLRKLFPLTFAMSILWIAIFSYLMLWWASEIGRTAGIDVEVMGLTFIAAGTSIPDLITSVVVARQGLGDMAVSSSIGSNIFDVTVGLPLPWLAFSISTNFKDVIVQNSGLFCSTILLFMMLLAVVITIGLSKWKMTKTLGASMFLLYVVFITITLLLQLNVFGCPFG